MSSKSLLNLGIAPDSGTGDSARRGGEKLNTLFADIYSNLGDNPVGQDPNQPFYGYRRVFDENEYKVGELHPAGKFTVVGFRSHDSEGLRVVPDSELGYNSTEILEDSEWFFLSRGENLSLDLREVDSEGTVHLVLPLGYPGDRIFVKDTFNSWGNKRISVWTSPYEFKSKEQVQEWSQNVIIDQTAPDSESIRLTVVDLVSETNIVPFKTVSPNWFDSELDSEYQALDQKFNGVEDSEGVWYSPINFKDIADYEIEFVYRDYDMGWFCSIREGIGAFRQTLSTIKLNLDNHDSDLLELTQGNFSVGINDVQDSDHFVDTFDRDQYRTAKYIVQATSENKVHVSEIIVTHNDSDTFFTEYGVVKTDGSLVNYNTELDSEVLTFKVVSTDPNKDVDVKGKRVALIQI